MMMTVETEMVQSTAPMLLTTSSHTIYPITLPATRTGGGGGWSRYLVF